MDELHEKYAPILRYASGERFFPMRVDDLLQFSALYKKDQLNPLVGRGQLKPEHLARVSRSPQIFLRSVNVGPLRGSDVIKNWSAETIELIYHWSQATISQWTEALAKKAYSWFSPKTQGATSLFWWNELLAPLLEGALESSKSGELPRFILPAETRNDAIEKYERLTHHKKNYAYYHRTVHDGNYHCLQFWFFYSYNDWAQSFGGFNDHEGDWEGMMIFFRNDSLGRPQEPPAYITYVGHHSRITKPWHHQDVEKFGTHPVGYVAAGSHAIYPENKPYSLLALYGLVDYATGDGLTIDHNDWIYRPALDEAPWVTAFRGSWGTRYWLSLERVQWYLRLATIATPLSWLTAHPVNREMNLPGVSAPYGPRLGDTGLQRPQWAGPVAWAEVPQS